MSRDNAEPRALERRRFPRQAVEGVTTALDMSVDIEVLEISLTGALLRCACPLNVGDRAQIRLVLDQQPFVTWASVTRVCTDRLRGESPVIAVSFSGGEHRAATLRHFIEKPPRAV